MPSRAERAVVEIVASVCGADPEGRSLPWLVNKHTPENCLSMYEVVDRIFVALGGFRPGLEAKAEQRLPPDALFPEPLNFILEVDEVQHFTRYKAAALACYPRTAILGFDLREYKDLCRTLADEALRKGASGYRACRSEFPFENGRAAQRAYFDAFRDLLAPLHGLRPTLRMPVISTAVDRRQVERRATRYLSAQGLSLHGR